MVIDCVGGNDISKLCASIFDAVLEEAKVSRPNGPPLSYIYCSGTWVHGNHLEGKLKFTPRFESQGLTLRSAEPYGSTSDRAPVDDPMPITAWRLIHEQRALAAGEEFSKHLTVNVVRPSLLYGKSASITGLIFATAREGEVKFAGTGRERIATIHCDDLGELFARVAEKVSSRLYSFSCVMSVRCDAAVVYGQRSDFRRVESIPRIRLLHPRSTLHRLWSQGTNVHRHSRSYVARPKNDDWKLTS